MANQTGIAINIIAWLPITGSIAEQIAALRLVESAHETGDYAELLKAAKIEGVKADQKTRRIPDGTPAGEPAGDLLNQANGGEQTQEPETPEPEVPAEQEPDVQPQGGDETHPLSKAISKDRKATGDKA